jgi:hypothetical protein
MTFLLAIEAAMPFRLVDNERAAINVTACEQNLMLQISN